MHMCTKFGDNSSKLSAVIVPSTNKHPNIQMKGQSEIAYLPKWNANDDANDENDDACEDDLHI